MQNNEEQEEENKLSYAGALEQQNGVFSSPREHAYLTDVASQEHEMSVIAEGRARQRPIQNPTTKTARICDGFDDGPVHSENYNTYTQRLATFSNFPMGNTVSPQNLAKAGFFFVGFPDRVKCFYCGRCVEHWSYNDDPLHGKWHRPGCKRPQTTISYDDQNSSRPEQNAPNTTGARKKTTTTQARSRMKIDREKSGVAESPEDDEEETRPMKAYKNEDPFRMQLSLIHI